jgi:hypothetical protein
MAKEDPQEVIAKRTFVVTMIGAALFIGVTMMFVVLQSRP